MKNEKTLNTNLLEEEGVINEVEETKEGTIRVDKDDEEGTLDIVPDVPQEFIDKFHRNVQTEHGTDSTSDNK